MDSGVKLDLLPEHNSSLSRTTAEVRAGSVDAEQAYPNAADFERVPAC